VTEESFDALAEGVVLVAGDRVARLNAAAATFLQVDRAAAQGAPLIAILRDHRMEAAVLERRPIELLTRGRTLELRPFPGGFLLRDVSEVRRAKDDARALLAVLSHELRTPVTTIRSVLEALRYDLPEAQRQRFLERAETEASRLVRLLEDLTVDVAPPASRSVPVREVAQRAVALVADQAHHARVTVRLDLPEGEVWCDADKLLQLFLNLIENAVVHGPPDATVSVVAHDDPERPLWLAIEVVDEGTPLEGTSIDGLFSPHARGHRATGRGTGLGLYVVRSIAERWGGRSWGRALAHGNAFGFTVPKERQAAQRG
jgi:two-component system, OmpR family, phosphate regulon sensor histidine kinase PhoR